MNFLRFFRTSQLVKSIINKINPYELQVPIGHFYSPIPNIDEIRSQNDFIFENKKPLGIDISIEKHLKYIQDFSIFYDEIPYTDEINDSLKYKFSNEMFGKSTGVLLFSFIRHLNPKRIIEVGSGHSSALMYDVNRLFYNDSISLTFIEPYPERLRRLFKSDIKKVNLIEKKVQEVDLEVFRELRENDILFIDSSHVSKVGSDVNKLIFEILPILNPGVYIHIHDIFYPFEYPKSWINNGTYWNELYLLRAFLMYNKCFSVEFFNTYAIDNFKDALKKYPLFSENIGGSIWIKKIH